MAPVLKPFLDSAPKVGLHGAELRPEVKVEVGVTLTREVLGRQMTVKDLDDLVSTCRAMDVPGDAVVLFAETSPAPGVEPPHNFVTARVAQVRDVRVTNPETVTEEAPETVTEGEPEVEVEVERCGECQMGLGTHNPRSPYCTHRTQK